MVATHVNFVVVLALSFGTMAITQPPSMLATQPPSSSKGRKKL